MRIVNFLKNQNLWISPKIFAPLAGQTIHGEPLGHTTEEITQALKSHFKVEQNVLLEDDKEINEILDVARSILLEHFDLEKTVIYLAGIDSSEDFANKYLGGVSGYAWPNAIFLYFNPHTKWAGLLLRTVLHEFNHCQRYRFSDPYKTFLDWLIFEGLAQAFEYEMTNSISTFEQDREIAKKYIPHLQTFWNGYAENGYQWFFGDETKNIPVGLGYSVGYYLVEEFRRSSPNMTWKELMEIPSHRFIVKKTII